MYERTCTIERAEDAAPGVISGILATDGEASDGHILNIKGGQIPERPPLLFGHDDFSGTSNLGSWTSFQKSDGVLRGTAQIELGGTGTQQAWRSDIAHMIDKGHIGQFSIRWDPIDEPVRRVNLPSDHPAYVDPKKAKDRQQWGLYFDKWRMLEGSVVTLGADPAALIGRMQETDGEVRGFWRKAINAALEETLEAERLVGIPIATGEIAYVERAAWEAMFEVAHERLQLAIDIHEDANELLRQAYEQAASIRSEVERSEERDEAYETAAPEPKEPAATLPATPRVESPTEMVRMLRSALQQAASEVGAELRTEIRSIRGRVS